MIKYRKPLIFFVCLYVLVLLVIASLPNWPAQTWIIATLISFAPLWVLALPLLVLVPLSLLAREYTLLVALSGALVLCLKLLGWTANFGASGQDNAAILSAASDPLVVMTANMGNASIEALNEFIVETNPDLVALQEVSAEALAPLLRISPLNSVCFKELCLLSHLSLKLVDTKSRVLLQHWGRLAIAMQVEVGLPGNTFDFYVLHLVSPREGFAALKAHPITGWSKMADVVDSMMTESWIASSWVAQGRNPIVAGDFNLSRFNPIYNKYWRWLIDSFHEAGSGFGFSKRTRVHGIQIDHILHGQQWMADKTWMGPSLGGDHAPVVTILSPGKAD